MKKAVFFDWSNTLADFYPPREELQSKALREFGIEISPERVRPALFLADAFLYEANAKKMLGERGREELAALYTEYERVLLRHTGADFPDESSFLMGVMMRAREMFEGDRYVLFDDVIPALEELKRDGLLTGLITNLEYDIAPTCRELGIAALLDVIVTSKAAGVAKPHPEIFKIALKQAGVDAADAVYVGDNYAVDIGGSRSAGMNPVLLDRHGLVTEETDCPLIRSLTGLRALL